MNCAELPDWKLMLNQPCLLQNPVLNDPHHRLARAHRRILLRCLKTGNCDLLDFKCDNITSTCQIGCSPSVVPCPLKACVDNKSRRSRRIWVHHLNAITERSRSHRCHAAKLSAAQNSDRRARKNCAHCGNSSASTSSLRELRHARNRSRRPESVVARISAAKSAALAAPGFPIASVPTGTPLGICTIESSESIPFNIVAG